MRLDRGDRRRLAFASTLTVAALPAIWLVNRDDARSSATRPNVAAVGLAAENASATAAAPPISVDPMGDSDPLFAGAGPSPPAPRRGSVAVGGTDRVVVTALATHSRSVGPGDACPYNGLPAGTAVEVLNPANGRSIDCVTTASDGEELVLHPDRFALLTRLSAAPVPVEIHQ